MQFIDVKPPEQVSVGFEGEYNVDPCDKAISSSLTTRFEEKLLNTTCMKAGSCGHKVSTTLCGSERKKRSQSTTITISLSMNIDKTGLGTTLDSLLVNKTGTCHENCHLV